MLESCNRIPFGFSCWTCDSIIIVEQNINPMHVCVLIYSLGHLKRIRLCAIRTHTHRRTHQTGDVAANKITPYELSCPIRVRVLSQLCVSVYVRALRSSRHERIAECHHAHNTSTATHRIHASHSERVPLAFSHKRCAASAKQVTEHTENRLACQVQVDHLGANAIVFNLSVFVSGD